MNAASRKLDFLTIQTNIRYKFLISNFYNYSKFGASAAGVGFNFLDRGGNRLGRENAAETVFLPRIKKVFNEAIFQRMERNNREAPVFFQNLPGPREAPLYIF